MARSAPSFSSFAAGEISPLLEGRTGIEKYREGLADLTNMVVMPQGGVKRRPGTEFLGEVVPRLRRVLDPPVCGASWTRLCAARLGPYRCPA